MICIVSQTKSIFSSVAAILECQVYVKNDLDLLQFLPLSNPLPFPAAVHEENHILCVLLQESNYTHTQTATTTRKKLSAAAVNRINELGQMHLQQDLAMLVGMLFIIPFDINAIVAIDYVKERSSTSTNPKQKKIELYSTAHSVKPEGVSKLPPLYTDVVLPYLPSVGISSNALYSLCSVVQRHFSSHCIQILSVSKKMKSIYRNVDDKHHLMNIVQDLQNLSVDTSIAADDLQIIHLVCNTFKFGKTERNTIYSLSRAYLAQHGSLPTQFVKLAQTHGSGKKISQKKAFEKISAFLFETPK